MVTLRPLDIHTGDYIRQRSGYRQKGGMFHLLWSQNSPLQKINTLPEEEQEQCQKAYDWLIAEERRSYKKFVQGRNSELRNEHAFNLCDYQQRQGVECAIWPNLYPCTEWCETTIDGRQTCLSTKVSFWTKVTSEIADYSNLYELLHFHYDLWLWQTVSGAIATSRKRKCTPNKALEAKTFSTEYWKWQHRYLIDAVDQFGPPSLFIMISPFEWSFPFPQWMENLRDVTGNSPTNLSGLETLHIVHVLEQIVRGYLCGSNTKTWANHVFQYNRKNEDNILTYFYRSNSNKGGPYTCICLFG